MSLKRALLAGLLLATIIINPTELPSCGPFFPAAVFTKTRTPPLPDYIQGRLGVLQPTFSAKYLFIAYRYLSEQPLSAQEIKTFIAPSSASSESAPTWTGSFMDTPAMKEWLFERSRISEIGPAPEIQVYRNDAGKSADEWRYFLNCSEDAFKTAARTLDERIKTLGAEHPGIRSWGTAQDVVFSNCSKGESIPESADAQLPQVLKYDRAYQIAAAHFYAEHYDMAAKMFRAIAADIGSPWKTIAPYLVARCLVRKATIFWKYGDLDKDSLREAEQVLHHILQDKNRESLHPVAVKLAAFVDLRLKPIDHIRALAERLQKKNGSRDLQQDLTDYLYLMAHANLMPGQTLDSAQQTNDMTDWILTFPSNNASYALERWKATGKTVWLLAAMTGLSAGDPNTSEVLKAAQKLSKDSPAFATAQYHHIRIMMESGMANEARLALDDVLPSLRAAHQNSSLNMFLAQRLELARSFDEFLEFAPRVPQEISNEGYMILELKDYSDSAAPLFDQDATRVLNRGLPLGFLSRAATTRNLPLHLRKQLIRAAWVRAALISDDATAARLSSELEGIFPELKSDLAAWRTAHDAESKQFALAMLLLHFPGMSPYLQNGVPPRGKLDGIDDFRENWWCGFNADGDLDRPTRYRYNISRYQEHEKLPEPAKLPSFLGDSDKAEFAREWNKLAALPTAPDYFGKIVLSWSAKHPKDERVPEALHLVVQATRFGCTDPETARYSKAAFQMLHAKYPNTTWAKLTPYWFR